MGGAAGRLAEEDGLSCLDESAEDGASVRAAIIHDCFQARQEHLRLVVKAKKPLAKEQVRSLYPDKTPAGLFDDVYKMFEWRSQGEQVKNNIKSFRHVALPL